MFRRADPIDDETDKKLSELLSKKSSHLTPPAEELKVHREYYDHIFNLLQGLCCNEYEDLGMQDVIMIGSYLKGTEGAGDLDGEIVVAFSTLPNIESITKVVRRLVDMYNRSGSRTASQESMDHSTPGEKGGGGYSTNLSGPVITGGDENPQDGGISEDTIYYSDLSTYSANIIQRQSGRTVVVRSTAPVDVIRRASDFNPAYLRPFEETLSAIRHAGWFQQHVTGPKLTIVRDLIRIMNDMRTRLPGLSHLSLWHVELLCQCASLPLDGGECLSSTTTFRRLFQLISAGLFLPGVLSIIDPCEEDRRTGIHVDYSPSQQDDITRCGQYVLRLLSHKQFETVLGVECSSPDVTSDLKLDSVVVRRTIPVVSK